MRILETHGRVRRLPLLPLLQGMHLQETEVLADETRLIDTGENPLALHLGCILALAVLTLLQSAAAAVAEIVYVTSVTNDTSIADSNSSLSKFCTYLLFCRQCLQHESSNTAYANTAKQVRLLRKKSGADTGSMSLGCIRMVTGPETGAGVMQTEQSLESVLQATLWQRPASPLP